MLARTRGHHVLAMMLFGSLVGFDCTVSWAGQPPSAIGVLEVHATYRDSDGTVHPLGNVDLEFDCDWKMRFPQMKTDAGGMATIKAAYSICELTAQTLIPVNGRSYMWTSTVEFSRTKARLELSSDDAIVLPELINGSEGKSPIELAGISGEAVLVTVVRSDGSVGKVSVLSSSNPTFERAAVAALKKRKYKPALKNGWPVEVQLTTRLHSDPR